MSMHKDRVWYARVSQMLTVIAVMVLLSSCAQETKRSMGASYPESLEDLLLALEKASPEHPMLDEAKALTLLFGDPLGVREEVTDGHTRVVEYLYNANTEKLSGVAEDLRGFQDSQTGSLRLRVELFESLSGNPSKFLLITSARPDSSFECHACSPTLSVAVFSLHGHQWRLETFNSQVTTAGEWGNAPIARMVEIEPGRLGVVLIGSYMHMGEFVQISELVALDAGIPQVVLSEVTVEGTSEMPYCFEDVNHSPLNEPDDQVSTTSPECWGKRTSLSFQEVSHAGLPDIQARSVEINKIGQQFEKRTGVKRFAYNGEQQKYLPVKIR